MTLVSTDPDSILKTAVEMELQGMDFYGRAASKMRNLRGKEMFLSLVNQERVHAEILQDQVDRLSKDKVWLPLKRLKNEASGYPTSVFQDKDIKKIVIGPDAGELDVIKLGMEVEKKSVEFYRSAGIGIRSKNAQDIFNWLVAQETGHLTILQAEYDYRTKSGFYMGDPEFSLEVF